MQRLSPFNLIPTVLLITWDLRNTESVKTSSPYKVDTARTVAYLHIQQIRNNTGFCLEEAKL